MGVLCSAHRHPGSPRAEPALYFIDITATHLPSFLSFPRTTAGGHRCSSGTTECKQGQVDKRPQKPRGTTQQRPRTDHVPAAFGHSVAARDASAEPVAAIRRCTCPRRCPCTCSLNLPLSLYWPLDSNRAPRFEIEILNPGLRERAHASPLGAFFEGASLQKSGGNRPFENRPRRPTASAEARLLTRSPWVARCRPSSHRRLGRVCCPVKRGRTRHARFGIFLRP